MPSDADRSLKQKAAAAFRALAFGDWHEFERIEDAIPCHLYEIPDAPYTLRLQGLKIVAQHYAIQHWRRQARLYLALFTAMLDKASKAEAARPVEAELLALDRAVARLAEIHGFDVSAMRRIAGVEPDGVAARYSRAEPDAATEAEMVHLLGPFLDDGDPDFKPGLNVH